jgi:hypothetical protein
MDKSFDKMYESIEKLAQRQEEIIAMIEFFLFAFVYLYLYSCTIFCVLTYTRSKL